MERLTNPDSGVIKFNDANLMVAIIDKLKIYEDAEEQGLLIRLSCKVGDTVWNKDLNHYKIIALSPEQTKTSIKIVYTAVCGATEIYFSANDVRKRIYLSKKAAEAAIRERQSESTPNQVSKDTE